MSNTKKTKYKSGTQGTEGGIEGLVQRLELFFGEKKGRIVTFIAAQTKEGTTTIARDYAHKLAEETFTRVLLLDVMASRKVLVPHIIESSIESRPPTISEVLLANLPTSETNAPRVYGQLPQLLEQWTNRTEGRDVPSNLLLNNEFRDTLRESFDTIVVDAPALQTSHEGLAHAAKSDAVVIVIEAGSTREAVVKNLRDTLFAAGAKIAGVVLNKRRLYIPETVYARL